ncbi:hypothetical protein CQ13_37380 [Bradyrhizobium retamae]|uniref:Uncharacterized protein n=1 Tax=Bradyrhizobium retamae TaxID=1300035 RepID=A0A0R3M532_9BRAD|nr:hypothetical protein CQ13_37380 [Bradyrhizobium retamae]
MGADLGAGVVEIEEQGFVEQLIAQAPSVGILIMNEVQRPAYVGIGLDRGIRSTATTRIGYAQPLTSPASETIGCRLKGFLRAAANLSLLSGHHLQRQSEQAKKGHAMSSLRAGMKTGSKTRILAEFLRRRINSCCH